MGWRCGGQKRNTLYVTENRPQLPRGPASALAPASGKGGASTRSFLSLQAPLRALLYTTVIRGKMTPKCVPRRSRHLVSSASGPGI